MKWRCLDHTFDLSERGEIMGIVNVTPDSFSDGGDFSTTEAAVVHALELIEDGAAIVDIGGESTRPGAAEVGEDEEKARVLPVIEKLLSQKPDAVISIDTCKPGVARAAVAAGAKVINDVTGFRDAEMIEVAAEFEAGLVAMHMQGTPRTMQKNPRYIDVIKEVQDFFIDRHNAFLAAGIDPERIVYDPGIGFGKTLEHNLELLRRIDELTVADRPILLGVSRKSFIGKLIESDKICDRNGPTVAITSHAREQGVRLHRVHEAKPNFEALRMTEAILTKP